MDIQDLKSKSVGDLQALAEDLDIQDPDELRRQDLLERIEENLVDTDDGLGTRGVLEILPEGYGFLRSETWSYLYGPDDVYVSPSQIKLFGLRTGDLVTGRVRPPRNGEKYPALLRIESVNLDPPERAKERPDFDELRPLYPEERFRLEYPGCDIAMRVVDLISPVGRGQRGLIVSPPKAGKTILLQQIARSISRNHPDAHLVVLLIDERPEEVTEMRSRVDGEVVASTFDESAERHVQVAEMVLSKAKRMVESGKDVVILLDSVTRLARAYNTLAPHRGKILSGGVEAGALHKPKRFFGSARNVEGEGSLTIVATALIETGSRMDDVIFEEFKGTGNMELILDRQIAERRIFPAIDINRSGTRREELLLTEKELNRAYLIRNYLGTYPAVEAIEFLLQRMERTETNEEFMEAMAQGG